MSTRSSIRKRDLKKKRTDQSSETPPTTDDVANERDELGGGAFPIVGIGASAGGLEAFTRLLEALPLDTGMGFVLVQHLDPDHESQLTQILGRATSLPVHEITNGERVRANHIYVIPRDTSLTITDGVLNTQPRPRTRTPHRPIDAFFESLAQDRRERAVGVVLSGTASDGTLGLEAIKAEGGITFAQDDSAKHDSMPKSAVAAGCVDLVLSPSEMAKELARIAKHPSVAGPAFLIPQEGDGDTSAEEDRASATAHEDDRTPLPPGGKGTPRTGGKQARVEAEAGDDSKAGNGDQNGYKKILLLLRNHSGVDFSLYKSTTIQRRITRRLVLSQQGTLEEYAGSLRGNSKELDALYSDVLISVTSFFRNPEMFDALQAKVLPELLKQRGDDPLRCWTLGCSTGQEAYSIAMAFAEAAEKAPRMRKLQIFATDLNDALLEKARHGLYAKSLAEDITPERLRRFFVEEEGGYRVSKALREMVVFARQNLIADPPFSRMDLVSCRNLLIYLEPSLQKRALPTFHYALKPGGFLLLGASESIGGFTDLFEPVDKKHKIYSKKPAPTPALHLPARKEHGEQPPDPRPPLPVAHARGQELPEGLRGELDAQREADRITVNQFAPPGVLVNAELQVLQFRGPTGGFLEPPVGKASFDVLKMAREGLMLPLRSAINQAKKDNKTARKDGVRVKQNGKTRAVNLEVIPLKNLRERCFLILFAEADKTGVGREPAEPKPARKDRSPGEESNRIAELETELSEMREYLQSMQEQHEAANEEIQSASEEIQSANEEMQSVNEELETSKEELESANEELTTVNDEMSNRNVELNRLNNDLTNFQTSTKLTILLLGRELTIRRFSPQAEKQFDLMVADVGRSLGHIRHGLVEVEQAAERQTGASGPREVSLDLEGLVAGVIAEVREQERQVLDRGRRWHSLRVRPYMTVDGKVDGAVLVLLDIDALKRSEQEKGESEERYRSLFTAAPMAVFVCDRNAVIQQYNTRAVELWGREPVCGVDKHCGSTKLWLPDGALLPHPQSPMVEVLRTGVPANDVEVFIERPDGSRLPVLMNFAPLRNARGEITGAITVFIDITQLKEAEGRARQGEQAAAHLAAIVTSSDDAIISKDLRGTIRTWNKGAERLFGYAAEEVVGKSVALLIPADRADEEPGILERVGRGESVDHYETVRQRKDGSRLDVSLTVSPIRDADGHIIGAAKIARDITERKRANAALLESEDRYRTLFDLGPVAVYSCAASGVIQKFNRRAAELWGREPATGDTDERFCGSFKLFRPDGSFMPHEQCPMAEMLSGKISEVRDADVLIERPDGSRVTVVVNIRPLKNQHGEMTGAINCFYDITERKRMEEALRESEDRYRTLVEQVKDYAIFRTDPQGRATTWNEGVRRVLGFEEADFLGTDITQAIFTPEAIQDGVPQRELDEAAKTGSASNDRWMRRKSGERFSASGVTTALKDADGKLSGFTKVMRDETRKVQAEEAGRRSHDELQARADELTRFNRVAVGRESRMIELKREVNELRQQLGKPALYPLELEKDTEPSEAAPAEQTAARSGEGLVPLDSILCTDELNRRPARPPDYETESRALSTLTQALADSPNTILQRVAEKMLEVFRCESAGFSLLTKDGKAFHWTAIAGAWKPHLGGGTPRDFGPCGDVLDCNAPLLFKRWERRYPYLLTATPLAEEGLLVPFHVGGQAVGTIWAITHDPNRKFDVEDLRQIESLSRFASAAYQVVELKQVQVGHRAALNLMEDAVSARQAVDKLNVELRENEERLRQYSMELTETAGRKNEFLAMLGHELRNPLSALVYGLDLLDELPDDNERRRELRSMMARQTKRIGTLLDQLLDIARVISGKVVLAKDRVDLADVLRAAVETVWQLVESQKHELTLTLPPDKSVFVMGDAVRLTQVVENLLTNAIKYTNAGGQIALSLEADEDHARIAVRDNGSGIGAELLPHIFEVFTQAPRTLDRAKGGLGLGLSLVQRLIEMHGGQAAASSPGLGQGSEFVVRLPRLRDGRSEDRLHDGKPSPAEPGRVQFRRILVVDDEKDMAETFAELLEDAGHQALAVHDGPSALAAAQTFDPEVVLLDLGLPEMDGYEVARRLREQNGHHRLLIAVTGYQRDAARLKQAGFDEHLIKPLNWQTLTALLAKWDTGKRGAK